MDTLIHRWIRVYVVRKRRLLKIAFVSLILGHSIELRNVIKL